MSGCPPGEYVDGWWIASIQGFAPLLEILQSYEPTAGPLSFTVPAMPESSPAADWLDTYYGDLATVGDWSQAQPLQCGYTATPPSVGDYLSVTDPLPDPAPGTGRYYVTAVTHQCHRQTHHTAPPIPVETASPAGRFPRPCHRHDRGRGE